LLVSSLVVMIKEFKKWEKSIFIVFSICCVFLAIIRPFGITRDDANYEIHAEQTGKITESGVDQIADYDIGYFFLLSIANVFFGGYQSVLFLAGVALAIKLVLIARITSYSMLSFYFYFSVFFLYHDVTQIRVSMAIAVFLLALYLMDRGNKKLGIIAYIVAMVTHFQAFISPAAQLSNILIRRRYWLAITFVILTQLAIVAHLAPASSIISLLVDQNIRRLPENFFSIDYTRFRISGTNVLMIFLLSMTILPLKRNVGKNKIFDFCFSSVVVGYMFFWLFIGIPVFPDRVLQFFWVPLAILVSLGRFHKLTYAVTILVGAVFFTLTSFIAPILMP
jgi:hypothetical protein